MFTVPEPFSFFSHNNDIKFQNTDLSFNYDYLDTKIHIQRNRESLTEDNNSILYNKTDTVGISKIQGYDQRLSRQYNQDSDLWGKISERNRSRTARNFFP